MPRIAEIALSLALTAAYRWVEKAVDDYFERKKEHRQKADTKD